MTIKTQKIDIFKADVDAIVQQANCFHVMGGGFSGALIQRWPEVYAADRLTKRADEKKLGTISVAKVADKRVKYVFNVYGQFTPGPDSRPAAFRKGLEAARDEATKLGVKSLGIPYQIGCGIGGGDWKEYEGIINDVFKDSKVNVLICQRD